MRLWAMATSSTLTEERLDPTYITIAESRPNLVALVEEQCHECGKRTRVGSHDMASGFQSPNEAFQIASLTKPAKQYRKP